MKGHLICAEGQFRNEEEGKSCNNHILKYATWIDPRDSSFLNVVCGNNGKKVLGDKYDLGIKEALMEPVTEKHFTCEARVRAKTIIELLGLRFNPSLKLFYSVSTRIEGNRLGGCEHITNGDGGRSSAGRNIYVANDKSKLIVRDSYDVECSSISQTTTLLEEISPEEYRKIEEVLAYHNNYLECERAREK